MLRLIFISTFLVFVSCGHRAETEIAADKTTIQSTVVKNENPIKTALTFINSYVDNCNKMKESIGVIEWVDSNKLTTNRFKTELKRIMEEAYKLEPEIGLDADPIFNAQDYPDKGFELVSFDSTTNILLVKGKNWPEFKLTIRIVKENANWLVDGCGMVNIPNDKSVAR